MRLGFKLFKLPVSITCYHVSLKLSCVRWQKGRQRRQSLPARPDMNSWSDQSMGYDTYSPSYSWNGNSNGNRKRSATFLASSRYQMSPYSDNTQQVSFSSPISTTFIEPDQFDYEYNSPVDRPLRRSSLSCKFNIK